jgi:ketosteroid isomerase-like protein
VEVGSAPDDTAASGADRQTAAGREREVDTMDAQGTMRLMFDTMDAYDRADFDRLAEIYAEDAQWLNADPNGPHCHNRDDIFNMFHARMASGTRIGFDELRSTPSKVLVTARAADFGAVVSVFSFQGRHITSVKDYPSMEAAEAALSGSHRPPTDRWWRRIWRRWRPGSRG